MISSHNGECRINFCILVSTKLWLNLAKDTKYIATSFLALYWCLLCERNGCLSVIVVLFSVFFWWDIFRWWSVTWLIGLNRVKWPAVGESIGSRKFNWNLRSHQVSLEIFCTFCELWSLRLNRSSKIFGGRGGAFLPPALEMVMQEVKEDWWLNIWCLFHLQHKQIWSSVKLSTSLRTTPVLWLFADLLAKTSFFWKRIGSGARLQILWVSAVKGDLFYPRQNLPERPKSTDLRVHQCVVRWRCLRGVGWADSGCALLGVSRWCSPPSSGATLPPCPSACNVHRIRASQCSCCITPVWMEFSAHRDQSELGACQLEPQHPDRCRRSRSRRTVIRECGMFPQSSGAKGPNSLPTQSVLGSLNTKSPLSSSSNCPNQRERRGGGGLQTKFTSHPASHPNPTHTTPSSPSFASLTLPSPHPPLLPTPTHLHPSPRTAACLSFTLPSLFFHPYPTHLHPSHCLYLDHLRRGPFTRPAHTLTLAYFIHLTPNLRAQYLECFTCVENNVKEPNCNMFPQALAFIFTLIIRSRFHCFLFQVFLSFVLVFWQRSIDPVQFQQWTI